MSRAVSTYALEAIPGATPEEAVYVNHLPTTHLYLFAGGMLAYELSKRWRPGPRTGAALAAVSAVMLLGYPYFGADLSLASGIPGWLIVDLSMAAFFFAAVTGSPILRPLLGFRPLRFAGEVSYSLFLLHQTVLVLLTFHYAAEFRSWAPSSPWLAFSCAVALLLALSVPAAYLSYRLVERPFLSVKPK